jgi:hypothetical protein
MIATPPGYQGSPPPGSYEHQLSLVKALPRAESDADRELTWCLDAGPVGVARDPKGHVEIFLAGPKLHARSTLVRENLEHQTWYRRDGGPLAANRLMLPAAGHFDHIAAFLCTELLRNGAGSDLVQAFRRTEPMIELAIQRLRITDEATLGLCGELLLLHALLVDQAADAAALVASWHGHREAPRDFQLGYVGIEVKTTTGQASNHPVEGVHQVEPGHGVDGHEESDFLLVSIGIQWADAGAGVVTLPALVNSVVKELQRSAGTHAPRIVEELLAKVKAYGGPSELGYDHMTMAESPTFGRAFRRTFVRCYDMGDEAIRVLRSDVLSDASHIDPQSVRFRLRLPPQVRGDLNPVVGLGEVARSILSRV